MIQHPGSMIQHPDQSYINLLEISLKEQLAHYAHIEAKAYEKFWHLDIKRYLEFGAYPKEDRNNHKKTIPCWQRIISQEGKSFTEEPYT